jgi:tetratricopeptide (TPR) repeat protein
VQVTRGIFAKIRGDEALALDLLRAGIERLRAVDPNAVALVNGLCHLAAMDAESGRHQDAFAHADEAVETARRSADPGTVPMALDLSAYVARVSGDAARAVAASEAAVALARETTSGQLPYALAGLAAARRDAGRHREAVEAAWEALAAADRSPSPVLRAEVDLVAAPIIAGGDLAEAARRLAQATATWLATGGVPSALGAAGQLATVVSAAEPEAAAQLIGAVERLHGKLDELAATADALRERLGDGPFARERGWGTALDPDGLGRLADEVARRLSTVAQPPS